ncbi:thiopeptide-type bacteriocin biosynthesis protein [Streptomyces sp. NBC_00239]|uniref:thiopeptide-type bacteriocin biosynthesis protein n=1 Tax=Streptomyces sp. NBC_00239 TaxID=2903640 RepID=UPI002E2B294F|nr:thiopeptide-type bacteriocin biosynthesis protein [Streptomyces sp. NBC_00239]
MNAPHAPQTTEHAVLAVLSGQSLAATATRAGIDTEELGDAVTLYRAAGQAVLAEQAARRDWHQVRIEFADFDRAEDAAATHLAPRLRMLEDSGLLAAWWHIRKAPCWRLRLLPAPGADPARLHLATSELLGALVQSAEIIRWWPTVYEPEVLAFGGLEGIDTAHGLFHADSRHFLARTHQPPGLGRREMSMLLCTALFRSAGLDWYEQGDVWDRVARMRPLPEDISPDHLNGMGGGLRRLLSLDTRTLTGPGGTMEAAAPWLAAFTTAGQAISNAAQSGILQRGPRDILAHHVIFHWNRHGLTARAQATLAHATRAVIMNPASAGQEQ